MGRNQNGNKATKANLVLDGNAPEVKIEVSYSTRNRKFSATVSEVTSSEQGLLTLWTPDDEDSRYSSKNTREITYTLKHGIRGTKESYGINWDEVNIVDPKESFRAWGHKELIESKGLVYDRDLKAYIRPNSNYKSTAWYKRKEQELSNSDDEPLTWMESRRNR